MYILWLICCCSYSVNRISIVSTYQFISDLSPETIDSGILMIMILELRILACF